MWKINRVVHTETRESHVTDSSAAVAGFDSDIKPLFREDDQKAMEYVFDLWDYDDVREHAEAILEQVESGSMPCDETWDKAKVETFRSWMQSGMPE